MTLAAALQTVQRNPLAAYQPRAGQLRFHQSQAQTRCLRGPNQIVGKSFAGCAESLWWLTHRHPYRDIPDRPVSGRLVPYSDDSSKEIEAKLFELLPKGLLHPDCRYHQDRGFTTGRRRMLRLRTGDSLGIVSQSAGTLAAAGATLDFIWFDEPPDESVYAEGQSRVIVRKGSIWLTLTPIGRPVGWLRAACEDGQITDVHVKPTPLNTNLTQPELDEISRMMLPSERPQRFGGEWEGLTVGRFFGAFDDSIISDELPNQEVSIGLGIDHGEREAHEAAVLVAFTTEDPINPKCWFLDEYISEGKSGVEKDAAGILDMLARWEVGPEAVDIAVGDHNSGGKSAMGYGINQLLTEAIARASGLPASAPPFRIKAAKKGAGSVAYTSRLIHSAMVKHHVRVNPRCEHLIDGFRHWTGPGGSQRNKALTHVLDAARYIGREFLDNRERGSGVIKVR